MGLDMSLRGERILHVQSRNRTDNLIEMVYDLGYWRKHPNLHGYIVNRFADGEDNCQPIYLGTSELYRIKTAINNRDLPYTEGFFFGASVDSREQRVQDTTIIQRGIDFLLEKDDEATRYVFYEASW